MSTKYEYYDTGDDTAYPTYDTLWRAQTFTPSSSHTVTSVKLELYRTGAPGTITVGIRATDGDGHPTGADLCSGTTNGDTLTTDTEGEWREITLGVGYALVANTKYAITVRATSGDTSNRIYWRMDNSSALYAGGNKEASSNGGGIWATDTARDFMFEEWGDAIVTAGSAYGVNWVSQTFTTTRAHTVASLKIKAYRVGSPGTLTVSIRATTAGVPSGADLTSGTYNADTLTTDTSGNWISVSVTSYNLTVNTVYAIVCRALTGDSSNKVMWLYGLNNPYPVGQYYGSTDSGSNWTGDSTIDAKFEIWGTTTESAYLWIEYKNLHHIDEYGVEQINATQNDAIKWAIVFGG